MGKAKLGHYPKMNIALVIIAFLGTLSGTIFASPAMPKHWHNFQIASVACLALAGVSAVVGLVPRNYKVGLSPNEFINWVKGVSTFYGAEAATGAQEKSLEYIHRESLDGMLKRYSHNRPINALKSCLVTCSYIFISLALGAC